MDTECANYTVNEIIEKFHQTNSDYTITDFFTKQIQKLKTTIDEEPLVITTRP